MTNEELRILKDADLGFFPIDLPEDYPCMTRTNKKDNTCLKRGAEKEVK